MKYPEYDTYHQDRQRKKQLARHFLGSIDPITDPLIAFTLTLRHSSRLGQTCDPISATQNFRDFKNRLNRKTMGNLPSRYPEKGIHIYPVLETNPNLHYHGIMRPPITYKDKTLDLLQLIEETWLETQFGFLQNHIEVVYSENWESYINKFRFSNDELDAANLSWPTTRISNTQLS